MPNPPTPKRARRGVRNRFLKQKIQIAADLIGFYMERADVKGEREDDILEWMLADLAHYTWNQSKDLQALARRAIESAQAEQRSNR